jgi:predicted Rossmann fold flavoprotein
MMNKKPVIVVGAGASGLLAAGAAAKQGARVILLDRMRETGRKLRISGKGRCNLTNTAPIEEFIEHFGVKGKFLRQALDRFSPDDLVTLLEKINLPTVPERGGRIFPADGDAVAVVIGLEKWVRSLGVRVITGARVRGLDVGEHGVTGLHYDLFNAKGKSGGGQERGSIELTSQAIILATGGKSYPATGSTGAGYRIAAEAGHTIIDPQPSLVPLRATGAPPRGTLGLELRNIAATLLVDDKRVAKESGELRFIDTGLSGPIALTLSRLAIPALAAGSKVELSLDLKPALPSKKLDARLIRDLESKSRQTWGEVVGGVLPRDLRPIGLEHCGVPADKPCHYVNGKERKTLLAWLKDYRFEITGHGSFKEAIVTAGGVDLGEVDPRTMMSSLVPGLFLVGELLDLDADTGGFNLQSAFSTGWVGGTAAGLFDPESVGETDPETESDPKTETDLETAPEAEPKTVPEPVIEPGPDPETGSETTSPKGD